MKHIICIISALVLSLNAYSAPDLRLNTVVIDAGHGGKDPGCVSPDGKTYEKNIVLNIAKKLETRINDGYPDVKVLQTRNSDRFVPLIERAGFATRNNASLFISLHVNAQKKGSAGNGYSVHLLGQSQNSNNDTYAFNMEVCSRENEVIYLEEDYSTNYQGLNTDDPESAIFLNLMHTAYREQSLLFAQTVADKMKQYGPLRRNNGVMQNNFAVLRLATMPAVLVEIGFITNPNDLAVLRNGENLDSIADALYEAFKTYKKSYDESVNVSTSVPEAKPVEQNKEEKAEMKVPTERYGTQIFAGNSKLNPRDSKFIGYTPAIVFTGKIYKYVIGVESSKEKALQHYQSIKKKYPDSFFVKLVGNNTERVK